eukprot:TRINITY_DN7497_c0_g1_i2.p1 TRINITY_DN7497_c0_g1~~TRINITY_DN7497_c0_g1_i2.p1  ORF type:complete len:390 (+),score=124.67 TRINITY_DN7497_c0_g1_i2:111-1280(+)
MRATASCVLALTLALAADGFVQPSLQHAAPRRARRGASRRLSMQQTVPPPNRRRPPSAGSSGSSSSSSGGGSMREMSNQMRDVRAQMEQNAEVKAYMDAMRGAALSDYDVAQGEMRLIDVDETDEEKLPLVYQPEILEEYYKRRSHLVVQRTLQLAGAFGGFMTSLAIDAARGTLKTNEVKRAAELREIITSLGPFYIKLGQALSIRPDILSPKAMVELQRLCDKVPSYDSKIAMATIERELGKPVLEVYSEITPEPLAAASLGQVYKATLRSNGAIVAVKVQRPGVLETVSLDLHLTRQVGYFLRKIPMLEGRTDLVALLDEFAYRFYEELDYQKEVSTCVERCCGALLPTAVLSTITSRIKRLETAGVLSQMQTEKRLFTMLDRTSQ